MILTSFSGVKLVHFGDNHVTLFSVPYLVPLFATLRGPRDRAEIDIADDGLPEMALLLGCTEVAVVVASRWQHVYSHWAASADRASWAVGPSQCDKIVTLLTKGRWQRQLCSDAFGAGLDPKPKGKAKCYVNLPLVGPTRTRAKGHRSCVAWGVP